MEFITIAVINALQMPDVLLVLITVSLALFTRAAIGFGDGLIAVPLLSLLMDVKQAVPLILFISTTMSLIALWKNQQYIQWQSLKRTSFMAIIGIPLGVVFLTFGKADLVKCLLGVVLLVLSVWNLIPSRQFYLKSGRWCYIFGFLAGSLGSAYALRGIVFAIYANLRGWGQVQFKSTIHSFYIISGVFLPLLYYATGLITQTVIGLYILSLPVASLATYLGIKLTDRLNPQRFQQAIWLVLLLLGLHLIYQYLS